MDKAMHMLLGMPKPAALLLLLVPSLFLAVAQPVGSVNSADVELLLAFKASFSNGAEVLSSWRAGTDPCSTAASWRGIMCNDTTGAITWVTLGSAGLVGTIPPTTGFILPETLEYLVLDQNSIAGSIPGQWRLPPRLKVLSLFFNQLTGSLAPEFALPDTMSFLFLNHNKLTGTLPEGWRLPSQLFQLYLFENQFKGPFPWASLPAGLKELWLENNQLTGTLAPSIPRLSMLRAGKNRFQGALPEAWNLSDMEDLVLSNNQLSSTLPAAWTFSRSLRVLELANNKLVGSLPQGWAVPPSVTRFDVAGNSLTGTLPSWPNLTTTAAFVQPGNAELCGEVPAAPIYTDATSKQPVTTLPSCSASPASDSGSGSNAGAIVGIVVGGVAGLAVFAVLAWFVWQRKGTQGIRSLASKDGRDVELNVTKMDSSATPMWIHKFKPAARRNNGDPGLDDPLLSAISSRLATSRGSNGRPPSAPSNPSGGRSTRSLGADVDRYSVEYQDLQFKKQIGGGSFGQVYLAHWRQTSVAVKLLLPMDAIVSQSLAGAAESVLSLPRQVLNNLQREAGLMAALRHPNVLNFLGLCLSPPCIISEYCPRGSLFAVLHDARESPTLAEKLTWPLRLRLALSAARGMHYLHSFQPPVMHRDLKSPNILITEVWECKICDFNLSKIMEEGPGTASSTVAVTNPCWLAPEVLRGESPSLKSDVYAFGVVLWEVLVWQLPFNRAPNPWQVTATVMAGGRPEIPPPEQLPGGAGRFAGLEAYVRLMQRCWAQEPGDRPSFSEVAEELRDQLREAAQGCSPGNNVSRASSTDSPSKGPLPLAATDRTDLMMPPPTIPEQAVLTASSGELGQQAGRGPSMKRCEINLKAHESPFKAMSGKPLPGWSAGGLGSERPG